MIFAGGKPSQARHAVTISRTVSVSGPTGDNVVRAVGGADSDVNTVFARSSMWIG